MKDKSFKFLFIYQAPQSGAKIEMKLKLHRPRPFLLIKHHYSQSKTPVKTTTRPPHPSSF